MNTLRPKLGGSSAQALLSAWVMPVQPVWRVRGPRKTRHLSPDPGCAISRARTRPVRALPPNLAGGFRSRPLLGSPLPLKSAQELSGNVSNHQPTVLCVRQVASFLRVESSHEGLRGCGQFLPEIGQ